MVVARPSYCRRSVVLRSSYGRRTVAVRSPFGSRSVAVWEFLHFLCSREKRKLLKRKTLFLCFTRKYQKCSNSQTATERRPNGDRTATVQRPYGDREQLVNRARQLVGATQLKLRLSDYNAAGQGRHLTSSMNNMWQQWADYAERLLEPGNSCILLRIAAAW